jgi:hypothetical protein
MMRKMTLIVATLAAIVLFLAVPVLPGTIPSSIVPESARWVAHLDMEKFVATDLYGLLEKSGKFQIKTRDLDRSLKMDVTKDVKDVTLFGLGPDEKDIVIAVAGKLDKAGIIAMIEAEKDHQKTAYGAYTIYSGDGDECGAFINDDLIVFSENRSALEKVLDTAGGKAKNFAGTPLSASLKSVPAGAFLGGVLPDLSGLGKEIDRSKVLEKASGLFFMAQEKGANIMLSLHVTANSSESAKDMADVVQGLIAMARLGGREGEMAKIASLLDGLQVKLDGKVLRLDFERPSKEIADLITSGGGIHID